MTIKQKKLGTVQQILAVVLLGFFLLNVTQHTYPAKAAGDKMELTNPLDSESEGESKNEAKDVDFKLVYHHFFTRALSSSSGSSLFAWRQLYSIHLPAIPLPPPEGRLS